MTGAYRLFRFALIVARLLLGLFGCLMIVEAVISFVPTAIGAPWGTKFVPVVYGFVGFLVAYGSFHHFPWERDPRFPSAAS